MTADQEGVRGKTSMGRSQPDSGDDKSQLQLVTFEIEHEEFGVDILAVQEINRMMQITPVPEAPAWVDGVINLRGRIITVVNLRRRFGLGEVERSNDQRIMVVEVGDRTIGFIVDRVNEVLRIDASIVEATPDVVNSKVHNEYIEGVGMLEDRLLILLSMERLFDDEVVPGSGATQRAA